MLSISDNLKVLQEQFAAALPDKIATLNRQYEQLDLCGWHSGQAEELYRGLHNLTGSAGTFGFRLVSDAARELQLQVKKLVDAEKIPAQHDWQAIRQALVSLELLSASQSPTEIYSTKVQGDSTLLNNKQPMIYIVEDDPDQAELLAQMLRDDGYRTRLFTDLNEFRTVLDDCQVPDAIVLDMIFPEGNDAGLVLLAELKKTWQESPPVVFVSVRDDVDARLAAYRAGASRFLIKPVSTTGLTTLLDTLTGRAPPQPFKVLLVDDDPLLLQAQATVLRAAGLIVEALTDSRGALDLIDSFRPEVLVLDMYMPDINGIELAALLRERDDYLNLPILFLSAETDMDQQLKAMNLGGDDFLVKSVDSEELVAVVIARARRARQLGALHSRLQTALYEREREHLALEHHAIVSVANASGDITYVNELFCRISGYSKDELIGENHGIVKSDMHPPQFYQDLWQTIRRGDVWKGEICNRRKDGRLYWVESTITPFMDAGGRPYQYVSIRTDISAVKAREEAQRAENAMRAIVGEAAARLLAADAHTLDTTIVRELRRTGEHLGADRAFLFQLNNNELSMSNTHEWCAPGIASQRSVWQDMSLQTIPWWGAQIRGDQPVIITEVAELPPEAATEKALFESLDIHALCGFPIRREGRTLGFFGFGQVAVTCEEDASTFDLLGLMASQIGNALLRAEGERVIHQQQRFTQDVLDSAPANIAVLNSEGVIVAVNEPWRRFAAANAAEAGAPIANTDVGTDYLAVRRQAEAADVPDTRGVVNGIESVMTGRAASFRHEYPCHDPDKIRWFEMTVTPLSGDGSGVVISHASITERKLAEVALSKSAQQLHATLESTKDGILAVGDKGDVLFMNRQFREMWNMSEALIQTTSDEQLLAYALTHIRDPEKFLARVKALYRSDEKSEDMIELTDGRIFERHSQSLKSGEYPSGRVWSFHDITERRRAEQAAESSKERLRRGQLFANIGTWEWNIVSGELFWTERIAPLFGYADGQLETSYDNFLAAVHPDDRQSVVDAVNACIEQDVPYDIEHRVVWPDGTERWLQERGAVVRDDQGAPLQMLGVVQDINDRKVAQMALIERERQLVEAQNLAALGNWSADLVSGELTWSNEIYRIFGYEPGTIVPSVEIFHAAVHPDDREMVNLSERQAEENGFYDIIHRICRPDGSIRHVHELARVSLNEQGKLIRLTGTVQDVTERIEAEQRVRETEQRFAFAVAGAGDGVWDWDIRTGNMTLSAEYELMLGYQPGELKPVIETWEAAIHPEDMEAVQQQVSAYLDGHNDQFDAEFRLRCKNGDYKWILCRGTIVKRDAGGNALRMIGIHSDINERKLAERALIDAREDAQRANQAKSDFLSSMSHELRTPMNAILGFGQLLEYDDALTDDHQDNVKEILKAGNHLLDLINDVLDLAKIESGRIDLSLEPVELDLVVEECLLLIAPLAAQSEISLKAHGCGGVIVRADRTRLKQVLLNLLSNAIKYNRVGGSVTLGVEPEMDDQVRILVTDTGHGVPPDRLEELFQPFKRLGAEQNQIEGTGIGLTITRRIIEMMNGKVDVKSKVGTGSTFWFELPTERLGAAAEVLELQPLKGFAETGAIDGVVYQTVLYIEDNPANLKLVSQILAHISQVRLITAHTHELGIELALTYQPSLILLDINLPGMDGYQVLKIIRSDPTLNQIPVVAVTANAMPRDIERGIEAGFANYLTKPLNVALFVDTVNRCLSGNIE